jgi:predicted nucleic acid-binding protein
LFQNALSSGWLTVLPGAEPADARLANVQLDEGELAALSLALQRGAAVLIDELRGRTVAAQLGLTVVGTLGLLLMARERGLVGSLRPMVELLQRGGYFLSTRLIDQVLANDGR